MQKSPSVSFLGSGADPALPVAMKTGSCDPPQARASVTWAPGPSHVALSGTATVPDRPSAELWAPDCSLALGSDQWGLSGAGDTRPWGCVKGRPRSSGGGLSVGGTGTPPLGVSPVSGSAADPLPGPTLQAQAPAVAKDSSAITPWASWTRCSTIAVVPQRASAGPIRKEGRMRAARTKHLVPPGPTRTPTAWHSTPEAWQAFMAGADTGEATGVEACAPETQRRITLFPGDKILKTDNKP